MEARAQSRDGRDGDEREGHEEGVRELAAEGRGRGEQRLVRLRGDARGGEEAAREVVPQRSGGKFPYGVRAGGDGGAGERGGARVLGHPGVESGAQRGGGAPDVERGHLAKTARHPAHALEVHGAPVLTRALVHHALPKLRLASKLPRGERGHDGGVGGRGRRGGVPVRVRVVFTSTPERRERAPHVLQHAIVGKRTRSHRSAKLRRERVQRRHHHSGAPRSGGRSGTDSRTSSR